MGSSHANHALVAMGIVLLGACSEVGNPAPTVTAVAPDVVSARVDTAATITGDNLFREIVTVVVDNDDPPVVDDLFVVEIDGEPMAPGVVLPVDPQNIQIVIPSGLELGVHGVTVTIPDGRSDTLTEAFTVVDCLADVCGDGLCCETAGEDSCGCPEDCGLGSCGDGCCQGAENAAICSADCPDVCGDGFCTGPETPLSCLTDCPDVCGNDFCTGDETCDNCVGDCATGCGDGCCIAPEDAAGCPGDCPDLCGDTLCTGLETCANCALDCETGCGDGCCISPEDASNCSADCADVCGDTLCTGPEGCADCAVDCATGCGDGCCIAPEDALTCSLECPDICGDTLCSGAETPSTCAVDCPDVCPDSLCTGAETCATCAADCASGCGDGCCIPPENPATCAMDCSTVCGDALCTGSETPATCPGDCPDVCPDSLCTGGENCSTCAADCATGCGDGCCILPENAATCGADCPDICGDTFCTGIETPATCAADCPDVCGDVLCTGVETCVSCAADCETGCGDGCCVPPENAATCAADCPDTCGDAVCTGGETCATCAPDCETGCGDGCCVGAETAASCPADCPDTCGDSFCTGAETFATCPIDCPSLPRTATGTEHTCARKTDGTVWCSGRSDKGQLGTGTTDDSPVALQVVGEMGIGFLTSVEDVAAGEKHSCGSQTDGTVWCWGHNDKGQLGDASSSDSSTPVQTMSISSITSVAAGAEHTCARKSDGSVWCWGVNDNGQLGQDDQIDASVPEQVVGPGGVGFLTDIADIGLGRSTSCAIVETDGSVWCWGLDDKGQVGNGVASGDALVPMQVAGLTGAVYIDGGEKHVCAVKNDGTVWCWGHNSKGQLGDDSTTDSDVPVQVNGPGGIGTFTDAIAVGCGMEHSCAVKSDGSMWCWGRDNKGQLGNGDPTTDTFTPVQVLDGATPLSSVATPFEGSGTDLHACAGRTDGTAYCWGQNSKGQLGDNTTTDRSDAVQFF